MLPEARKTILVVLFVPSVERDGITPVDQDHWTNEALASLGRLFGGATAFPRAEGVWRDDERGGVLVRDQPIIVHCYVAESDVAAADDTDKLTELGAFCCERDRARSAWWSPTSISRSTTSARRAEH